MEKPLRRPIGVTLLVAFFLLGLAMCGLTSLLLTFPGTAWDTLWRLKPSARDDLLPWGALAVITMLAAGAACALAAIGLARRKEWGRRIAVLVLAINLFGDTMNAFIRHDWRTLVGLPIGGAMIAYLFSTGVRQWIAQGSTEA